MMKSIYLFLSGCLCVVGSIKAQSESDSLREEPGRWKQFLSGRSDLGVYLSINYGLHPLPDGYGRNGRVEFGGHYEQWIAGAYYAGFDDTYQELLIFPSYFDLLYEHAGGFVGYQLLPEGRLNPYLKLSVGHGFIAWDQIGGSDEIRFRDNILFIQTELEGEYILLNFLRLLARAGYQHTSGYDLPQVQPKDLSGWYCAAGIKLGVFKRWDQ